MSLGRHVRPNLPPDRIERQLAVVRSRHVRWRAPRFALRGAAVGAFALLVVLAIAVLRRPPSTLAGTSIESGDTGNVAELPDGSRVEVERGGRVTFRELSGERVTASLERGRATFDVTPRASRAFTVAAAGYLVAVKGTRFTVSIGEATRVEVAVQHGTVEVRSPTGTTKTLEAGERWTSPDTSPEPPAASATASDAAPPPQASSSAAPEASPEVARPITAKDLLDEAQTARAAGRPRDAARALDALRRRFRGDPRAGLAAFELGRLRMDSFHDAAGALEALGDAIAIAPGAPFREDAEARRVRLLARSPSCESARDAYLARYPSGAHRAEVEHACAR